MHCNPAASIITKLGGPSAVAAIVGVEVSTVQRWRTTKTKGGTGGAIPHWHHQRLLKEAKSREVPLEPVDFFRSSEGRVAA